MGFLGAYVAASQYLIRQLLNYELEAISFLRCAFQLGMGVIVSVVAYRAIQGGIVGGIEAFTDKTIVDRRKLGKMLEEVRQKGYSLESEEEHPGVGCIGAPVRDSTGRWVAAISAAGPLGGTPFRLDAAHIKLVQRKAEELSERMSRLQDGAHE